MVCPQRCRVLALPSMYSLLNAADSSTLAMSFFLLGFLI